MREILCTYAFKRCVCICVVGRWINLRNNKGLYDEKAACNFILLNWDCPQSCKGSF